MDDPVAAGQLVVRASGAAAALMAIEGRSRPDPPQIQILLRANVPRIPEQGVALSFGECSIRVRGGVVLVAVATGKLSVGIAELRPLLFQPVPLDRGLQALVGSSVAHLIGLPEVDPHGARSYVLGLAELVLRGALRTELDRADALATRRRAAVEYIREHLADPELGADRIAEALFVSRRRLYQLFDDGEGVSGRIRAMRIERARELLGDPALGVRGIGEISRQCGFANAAHFSRTFRKVVGEAPSDYRERVLG
ncbi:AraC-like DNA-binding protein [Actinokineospora baliensis]|uniref:helix-turn-helix transcriptional regulator n=1 Tax=Actinokineospora baliensis TaxID=547056 RepID=UPI00195974CF|nr:AraC family transcriptional regulator [Actinokineospora baliensis]MBM7770590.1 AraC-like DNA-binding protein [Actinokineospora baliensis]